MEPWGTPHLTSAGFELYSFNETNCFLLLTQDVKHLFEIPLTLYYSSFFFNEI